MINGRCWPGCCRLVVDDRQFGPGPGAARCARPLSRRRLCALRVRRLPMAANIQNGVCRWLGNLKVGRIELQAILYWLHWTKPPR